jgi:predicted amidohydrolase YtcJ
VCVGDRPTGDLREHAAVSVALDAVPERADEQLLAAYRDTFRPMNEAGLAGAHVMLGDPSLLDTCRELVQRGWLTMRLVVPLDQEPGIGEDEIEARLPLVAERGRRWRSGSARFFIDGVVETGTAWLDEPDTNEWGRSRSGQIRSAMPTSWHGSPSRASSV